MEIDVFNINDTFFNDICYPFTDGDSNSDMILSDRVSDIYQNYSICGDNCQYDSFNIEKSSANCNCKIKKEVNTETEEGNFENSITSAFFDSNFGVIKCFNLVFSFEVINDVEPFEVMWENMGFSRWKYIYI